ncbi:MAG: hypothetical protein IKE66_14700 [Hyphomicrobium sp.]|nr:hypothetical protein [Hyphomicrobium sp.]
MGAPQTVSNDIERLNSDCTCVTLDRDALCRAIEKAVADPEFCQALALTHPYLLSAQPVFLTKAHAERMQQIIWAIEAIARLPQYQSAVLGNAAEIAQYRPGPIGVFMGYDFHLGEDGPMLIEINTNAGGALINAYLLQAQRACCDDMNLAASMRISLDALCSDFVASFDGEWKRQGRAGPLETIAIVDHAPREQYLYPEFVLFQRLFEKRGMGAIIASPAELAHRDGYLWHEERRIDLVYNRLTDFQLEQPESAALRSAYLAGDVVVTPNPWTHAVYANKSNLVLLSADDQLRSWGVSDDLVRILKGGIPRTIAVTPDCADELWSARDQWFFKPTAGYGGKAAYRGDKITRRVWTEILNASYVAQRIVTPSTRKISIDGIQHSLKADLRNYTYDGKVQLIAARLYQGQTTNFRTQGGGFAPVFVTDGASAKICR